MCRAGENRHGFSRRHYCLGRHTFPCLLQRKVCKRKGTRLTGPERLPSSEGFPCGGPKNRCAQTVWPLVPQEIALPRRGQNGIRFLMPHGGILRPPAEREDYYSLLTGSPVFFQATVSCHAGASCGSCRPGSMKFPPGQPETAGRLLRAGLQAHGQTIRPAAGGPCH